MDDKVYTISQAAREVGESASVLRYWEDVLQIRIRRDQKGYRCYTGYDIQLFLNIKELKKRGLKLEAIREVIPRIYQYGPGAPKSRTRLLEEAGEESVPYVQSEEEIIDVQDEIVGEPIELAEAAEDPQEIKEAGGDKNEEPIWMESVEEATEETEEIQELIQAEAVHEAHPDAENAAGLADPIDPVDPIRPMDPMDEDLRITEFQSILEKLIAQGVKEKNQEELRIRKLDEKIRFHQQSMRQVAAAQEMKQRRGRGRRRKKR